MTLCIVDRVLSSDGKTEYDVTLTHGGKWFCNCPDMVHNRIGKGVKNPRCKHILKKIDQLKQIEDILREDKK